MSDTRDGVHQVDGSVIDSGSGRGIPGLRVEAWDKGLIMDDLVGQATTDDRGRFHFAIGGEPLRELLLGRGPELYFKVFAGRELRASTQHQAGWNPRTGAKPLEIAVHASVTASATAGAAAAPAAAPPLMYGPPGTPTRPTTPLTPSAPTAPPTPTTPTTPSAPPPPTTPKPAPSGGGGGRGDDDHEGGDDGRGKGNGAGDDAYTVSGRVASFGRPGVGGLRVEIVDKNVGGDVALASAPTDDRGRYSTRFGASKLPRGKVKPDLQARAYSGQTFLAATVVRYDASHTETLDIELPPETTALPSEWETLTDTVAAITRSRLADLKETDERQDITYLANKTGWDARAVALAALADQFSRATAKAPAAPPVNARAAAPVVVPKAAEAAIDPAFYYALFRAGIPANAETVHLVPQETLTQVWTQAVEQGVIPPALAPKVGSVVEAFKLRGADALLNVSAPGGSSTLKDLLAVSRLGAPEQQRFARLYGEYQTDLPAFWRAVEGELGKPTAARLQLDGKLASLTFDNAPLMTALNRAQDGRAFADTADLARRGYHRAARWTELLTANVPVPPGIPGANAAERRQKYAELLAAQVRVSHPTASLAELVQSGDLPVARRDDVAAFLGAHDDFEVGAMPVQQYVARKQLEVPSATLDQVQRLQRVYQITPNDGAMAQLLKAGVDSAAQVARRDRTAFVDEFANALGGPDAARQVHDRAVQIHNAVLNVAVSYLTARNGIPLGARALGAGAADGQVIQPVPAPAANANANGNGNGKGNGAVAHAAFAMMAGGAANAGDVLAYATLEDLFGEMDYCACDHCRSVLSPAAYLVDLLHFIDQPPTEVGKSNPQTVLLERRPDIQHLPLTCENTNVALPYIDVVNETLEYFITNGVQPLSLNGYVGHDTDGVASADLLAQPQFVVDAAYVTLRDERFPMPLPFHQPLERLRRYFEKFEVPLPLAMERLRTSDALERAAGGYGWRDILMEELGLSRAEHEILTDSAAVPLARMYGFAPATTDAAVVAALSNARDFSRRMGITYEDVAAILRTRFVNPNADLIPQLERLGVPFAALAALKAGTLADAAFDAMLPTGALAPDPAMYGGDIKAWVKQQANNDRIMAIITLTDPTAGGNRCDFASLEFRVARPMAAVGDTSTRIGAVDFVRMLRFIRVWKKLGWSIADTDAVLCALFPVPPFGAAAVDTLAKLDTGFRALLPRLGVTRRLMRLLDLSATRDLRPLLALWSPLDVRGTGGLYREMFLSPALLARDPAFAADAYGQVLQSATDKLVGHKETLRAAFNMTSDELSHALTDLGFAVELADVAYDNGAPALMQAIRDVDPQLGYDDAAKRLSYTGALTAAKRNALKAVPGAPAAFPAAMDALYAASQAALTPLTLENLSAVFRRGWLARKLKVSVRELLLLSHLTGLDPFVVPDPTNPAVIRLVELVQAMKARSFKSAAALYLIWNQDLSGKSAPKAETVEGLARTLRADFVAIEDQFAVVEDPGGDVARARMTLVYGAELADAFFDLLDGTLVLDVPYTHGATTLEAAITAVDAALGYDRFRHRLSHTGLLGAATGAALKAVPGVTNAFRDAVDALVARSANALGSYFARAPELKPLYDAYIASGDPPAVKRRALLEAFRPELSRRRKRQQALQRMSAQSLLDLPAARALLDPPAGPFPLHAAGQPARPALDDVLAVETPGLAAAFYFRDTATGLVDQRSPAEPVLDYAAGGPRRLPANPVPGADISVVWSGRLEAPETGLYNIIVDADAGATVTLTLDGQVKALTQNGTAWRNTGTLELTAGTLYDIRLVAEKVSDVVAVRWETPKRPREVIPSRWLYTPTLFAPFTEVYVRLFKAASLLRGLGVTANELAHFATDPDHQVAGEGWLNVLPVTGDPSPAVAGALLAPLRNLLDFARIKAERSANDESLLEVLRAPAVAAQPDGALYALTRWDRRSLQDLLAHFGVAAADLAHFARFRQVYDAMALATTMGISTTALLAATTNEPVADTARALDAALRARYADADWRTVVQPINDALRGLQRDALVAYILHRMRADPASAHIDTPDKLFEYFLTDVQMEPCMLTSRIRHALSSVQLFIERCLMNLEPRVSPSSVNAAQWSWMKRYRVWEANRKVFLFPENWLEPELRDDKSPFFKEIESELLQGDITDDSAAVALLNYLAKLEEVAKLEPCGIHHVAGDLTRTTDDVEHVVARTSGAHRKYYYRRREFGYWTPWEQIKLDIEGDPVVPVVWKGRLLLLWLRVMKQTSLDPAAMHVTPAATQGGVGDKTLNALQTDSRANAEENAKVYVNAVLCWSEYYNGKWQAPKTSDIDRPTSLGSYGTFADFDRTQLKLLTNEEGENHHLRVTIDGAAAYSTFVLYNTHSLPAREEDDSHTVADMFIESRYLDTHLVPFRTEYYAYSPTPATLKRSVLTKSLRDSVVATTHPLADAEKWLAPFFYRDQLHVFYVTTTAKPVQVRDRPVYGGVVVGASPDERHIPKLVYTVPKKEPPPIRFGGGGDPIGPDIGVANAGPLVRFVTEDVYIDKAIGSAAPVQFGDRVVNAGGSVPVAAQLVNK